MLDEKLTIATPDGAPRVLVLGTASDGLSEELYRVRRPNDAVNEFGRTGSLIRGMFEAKSQGAKAVYLMRIGGTRASLTGVGCIAGGAGTGYTITPNWRDDDAGTRYSVFFDYSEDLLMIYDNDDEEWVYSNDSTDPIDLGVVSVTGGICASVAAPDIGTVSGPLTMVAAAALHANYIYTAGTDGTSPSRNELWEALYNAYELLDFQQFDVVIPMDAYLDDANVADQTSPTWTKAVSNSYPNAGSIVTGEADALGRVHVQKYQGTNYFWWDMDDDDVAEIFPSVGASTANTDAKGDTINSYIEVNFAYDLANFCYNATENFQACHGIIGTNPPNSLGLADVATWVGELPEYAVNPVTGVGTIASASDNGTGLLGNKFMAGAAAFRGGEQYGGFIASTSGYVDNSDELSDENDALIDIGKYLSVVAAWVVHNNGYDRTGRGYIGSFAASYGGLITTLGSASAPTNKIVSSVRLPYVINASTLDDLATNRYIVLVGKPKGVVVADAPTAARPASDYNRLTTVRIVSETVQRIRNAADAFLGEPINSPQIAALETALESVLNSMKQEGKIQDSRFTLRISPQDAVLGTARVDLLLVPAFELRRIFVSTSLAAEIA